MMRDDRGFTLLELMIAVAIAGVLAAGAVATWRSAVKNAASGDAAFDVAARLEGLRVSAMRDGAAYGALVMDTVGNDTANCRANRASCTRICIIGGSRDPLPASWDVTTTNPSLATLDCTSYTNGVRFLLAGAQAPPPPFQSLTVNDPVLVPTIGGRRVLGLRFETDGRVRAAVAGAGTKNAVAIVISSDALSAVANKGVIVTFPYGLVRTYSF